MSLTINQQPRLCPPPHRFRPAVNVSHAEWGEQPSFIKDASKHRNKGKRADGVNYEKKVHKYLEPMFGDHYIKSPWFHFISNGRKADCQADALLTHIPGTLVIVEVKLSHTSNAWWQTTQLYQPVVEKLFEGKGINHIRHLEVVKWFDPAVPFPQKFNFADDPTKITGPHDYNVHIWNGR